MFFFKDMTRLILLLPATVFILILRLFRVKLVFVDSARIGHFFCDPHLYAQTLKITRKETFLIPLSKESILSLDSYLPKHFRTIYSPALAKFTGWFRHFSWLVVNVTNSHTHINDIWLFRKKHLKNKYRDLTEHFDAEVFSDLFQEPRQVCTDNEYVAFHWRSGWDNDEEQSFRNTDYSVAKKICSCFVDFGYAVVNLGAEPINLRGVENPRLRDDFDETNIFEIIFGSSLFVGDSSGPTMVALLLNKPALIFDIFPPEIFPLNSSSLVHYVDVGQKDNKTDNFDKLNDSVDNFRLLTKGSELERRGLTLKKLTLAEVKVLVDEFICLNRNGPNIEQEKLQQQYLDKFNVKQNIGFLSHKLRPNYL